MKNLLITLVFAIAAIAANAQRGEVLTITADTLNGNETVNFDLGVNFTGEYDYVVVQALCTQVGGTSDGTLALYGSLDGTSYSFINGVGAEVITASPKASITGADLNQVTITNGLVASWVVKGAPYKKLRLVGVGTASDSTLITPKFMYK
jgi:hypothetical protein